MDSYVGRFVRLLGLLPSKKRVYLRSCLACRVGVKLNGGLEGGFF